MDEIKDCIENCLETHRVCLRTLTYCLSKATGEDHSVSPRVRLLIGCADICRVHADAMIMGSEFHGKIGAVCAEICDRCAEDCERSEMDERMRACARACRRSARSCREMAAMAGRFSEALVK